MITLKSLHDATLKGFKVDWATGDILFEFKISKEGKTGARIIAKDFKSIECPKQMPWGPSISVNEITEEKVNNRILLTIEMQTGDSIKTNVSEFILEAD